MSEFHKVGEFYTHFPQDMDHITDILINGGYSVCKTLSGDMIIMSEGDYDTDDIISTYVDDDEDDDDHGGYNIKHFPRNY